MNEPTSDPRTAALAEALDLAGVYEDEQSEESLLEIAAAILAALPPDWCGHTTWRQTDTFNVWTGTCGHLWLATTGPDCPTCAEIARLRRIEEAARAVIAEHDEPGIYLSTPPIAALRAALEEKP